MPSTRGRVGFVSLSFDPVRDTPAMLALYGAQHADGRHVPWDFLTTRSRRELLPILKDWGQDVGIEIDRATGKALGTYSHVLKVFLIDRRACGARDLHDRLPAAGDGAQRHQDPAHRGRGQRCDELAPDSQSLPRWSRWRPAGNPAPTAPAAWCALGPAGVPVPPDAIRCRRPRIDLGRTLFMDRRLSHNNTLSCGMCHVPEQGFTSNELGTAIGLEGQTIRRNSPTIYNVAYVEQLFHDGREFSLENQAWGPLLAGNEMANPSIGYVVEKIKALPEYAGRFEAAFAGRGPDMMTIGLALAAYQRTLNSANSRFDRWRYGGEANALNAEEQAGFGCSAARPAASPVTPSARKRHCSPTTASTIPASATPTAWSCRAATACSWHPASSSSSRTRRWIPSKSAARCRTL
jgi:cytochrome c peroxidase